MELERISVVLRPRGTREAIDLGAAMLRAHARPVWAAWFAFTLPAFVAFNALGVLLGWPWLGWVLMWWLRPVFDRVPLYVLSRAVFDQAPGWREALRGQRQWSWRRTLAGLTWLRIDSNRALRLPLELLEGSSPQQRSARWRVLRRRIGGQTSLLTYGCLQFELVLFLSFWLLALLLIPQEWRPASWEAVFGAGGQSLPAAVILCGAAVAYLAMSAIEPLYVACGFALYLNRRTELEAWDIDLAFRRLRKRLHNAGKVVVMVLLCGGVFAPYAHAQTKDVDASKAAATRLDQVFAAESKARDQQFGEAAARVYQDERFGGEHTARRWRPKYERKAATTPPRAPFAGVGKVFAVMLKALLWLLALGALGALLVYAWKQRGRWIEAKQSPAAPLSQQVHESMVDESPLPADLAVAARALWQAQRRREALALLYRGCVEQTAQLLQLPPSTDATEADWLRQARAIDDPERAQRVVTIVRTWQFAAYAGRYPDDATVEQLLRGWPVESGGSA